MWPADGPRDCVPRKLGTQAFSPMHATRWKSRRHHASPGQCPRVSPSCRAKVMGFRSKSGVLQPSGISSTSCWILTPGMEGFFTGFPGEGRRGGDGRCPFPPLGALQQTEAFTFSAKEQGLCSLPPWGRVVWPTSCL